MTIKALASEAELFVKSSAFRFGDRTGFNVPIHESILLPGNASAADYLDSLGLDSVPERVLVVCPVRAVPIRGGKHDAVSGFSHGTPPRFHPAGRR